MEAGSYAYSGGLQTCVFQAGKVSGAWQDFRAHKSKVIEQTGFRDCAPVMWGARMSQTHLLQTSMVTHACHPGTWEVEGKIKNSRQVGTTGALESEDQNSATHCRRCRGLTISGS